MCVCVCVATPVCSRLGSLHRHGCTRPGALGGVTPSVCVRIPYVTDASLFACYHAALADMTPAITCVCVCVSSQVCVQTQPPDRRHEAHMDIRYNANTETGKCGHVCTSNARRAHRLIQSLDVCVWTTHAY